MSCDHEFLAVLEQRGKPTRWRIQPWLRMKAAAPMTQGAKLLQNNGPRRDRAINSGLSAGAQQHTIDANGSSISAASACVLRIHPSLAILFDNRHRISVIIAGILGFVARHFADLSVTSTANQTTFLSQGSWTDRHGINRRNLVVFEYHDIHESVLLPKSRFRNGNHRSEWTDNATSQLPHRTPANRKPIRE